MEMVKMKTRNGMVCMDECPGTVGLGCEGEKVWDDFPIF